MVRVTIRPSMSVLASIRKAKPWQHFVTGLIMFFFFGAVTRQPGITSSTFVFYTFLELVGLVLIVESIVLKIVRTVKSRKTAEPRDN